MHFQLLQHGFKLQPSALQNSKWAPSQLRPFTRYMNEIQIESIKSLLNAHPAYIVLIWDRALPT